MRVARTQSLALRLSLCRGGDDRRHRQHKGLAAVVHLEDLADARRNVLVRVVGAGDGSLAERADAPADDPVSMSSATVSEARVCLEREFQRFAIQPPHS